MLPGPFKVVLSALERNSTPDTLGDPTAARVRNELGRLFQLDDETASNILSAVPIVILDGLDVRAAGVVRDRLHGLREAGCRVVITDEVTDTIPRVNWPQLPPIARVERAADEGDAGHRAGGGLSCPHCGGGLQVIAGGASPPTGGGARGHEVNRREPEPASRARAHEPPPPPPAREPAREPAVADDDWLSPPVGAVPAAAPPAGGRRQSGRFDDAALLAYRRAEEPSRTTSQATASEVLEVSFSDSGELEPAEAEEARRRAAEPRRAAPEPAPELLDADVFEEPPRRPATEPRRAMPETAPELLDSGIFEEPPRRPAAEARRAMTETAPELLDSDVFEEPRGRAPATSSARRPGAAAAPPPVEAPPPPSGRAGRGKAPDPFEDSLGGLDPAPVVRSDPFASSPARAGASASRASSSGLDPFEDSRILDDLSGFGGGGGKDPLEDSGSDILDEPPPHRRSDASRPGGERFESDLDLFEDGADLDASDVAPAPAPAARRGGSAPARDPLLASGDDLQLLDSDDRPPPPKQRKGSGGRTSGARSPDLDEVLNMFGPEDDAPLDDGSGLEPAPLDLSPPSRGGGGRPARGGAAAGGAGFDPELSDILEPLDPGEALEIIKTSKPGRREAASTQGRSASGANGRHSRDEPSGLEQLDLTEAGAILSEVKQERRPGKKSRGVPFPATDEDVDLFEDSSRSGRPQKKKTDPFARARGRMLEEDDGRDRDRDRRGGAGAGGERERRGAEASGAVERPRAEPKPSAPAAPSKRAGGGAPPPSGDGEHGLVLSRIADPEKKEQAAEIIAEVKGCSIDEARRLTDRTIIPVLKGVSRETAEHHLEKFKRVKIAGRVTTRQRG
ncbi:MAG: hypothetical protein M9894_31885 [Planctomycetes bacterium]|nr:hypothetical protein [Planctomycetota bacterium]